MKNKSSHNVFYEKLQALRVESWEIEKDFSSLSEEKRQAEDSVKESKEGTEKLEKELEEAGKKTRSLKEDMGKDREKLESLIYENINRKVNILLNNGAIG